MNKENNVDKERLLSLRVPAPNVIARLEERIESLVLPDLFLIVSNWVEKRPLLRWSDSRKEEISSLIVGEVQEFVEEVRQHNGEALLNGSLEVADIYFFVFSFLFGNQIDLDFSSIKGKIDGQNASIINKSDGQGATPRALDRLHQIGGDFRDYPQVKTAEEILKILSSFIIHLDNFFDPQQVMLKKIGINSGNYPEGIFAMTWNGTTLTPDEYETAFKHRVRCLRLIRRANKLSNTQRKGGLLASDYENYISLIMNVSEPQMNFLKLAEALSQQFNLTLHQLLEVESESHKLVAGYDVNKLPTGVLSVTLQKELGNI